MSRRIAAEDAGSDAAPGAAHPVQRPDAQHVVDLPAVLRLREQEVKQRAGAQKVVIMAAGSMPQIEHNVCLIMLSR
jgi:hypothetical protein